MDASSSSSSMSGAPAKYDVFLSFRGEDTRDKFTSHLHTKLMQKSIDTYIDYRLEKGDKISVELIKAIRGSKISVIILSENYAFSSWCLDEVLCILECEKEKGQIVVPVFYDVEPTHIRKQLDVDQSARQKHMKNGKADMVDDWRAALKEVAGRSGWDSQNKMGTEAEFVEAIAKDLLLKLNAMYSLSNEFKDLVGIDKSIKEMERLICIENSTTVRMIGIWGMGGLGKTTLARVLFKRLSSKFEGRCFLANVREESGKSDGLESLEKKLFSELLEETNLDSTFAKKKLRCKKVLIVLDDVDDLDQLEVLAADHDWFGCGSRIILTTRDASMLRDRADEIYQLKGLGLDDALQLFNMNASRRNSPTDNDAILSKRVVNEVDGNPLALKVLGSFLRSKRKESWETELKKLKDFPNQRIHNILKISFNGLDEMEKAIFLDIACFFRIGLVTCRKFVERILGAQRSYVDIGINSLIDKSLIAVKDSNSLVIHDLLREMGEEIERQQCKRTRLWHDEHLYYVFKNNAGTPSAIEGISCFIDWKRDWSPTIFQGMNSLWLLHVPDSFSDFPQGLRYIPDSLKCLIWQYWPWKSLPSNFMAHNLVELRMPRSKLEQLWSGVQDLGNLKYVDLSRSSYLTDISALSQAANLVSVDLSFCTSLHQVPPLRFQIADELTYLDRSYNNCYHDECRTTGHLKLDYCVHLKVVEKIYGNLKALDLSSTSILELRSSICSLSQLDCLNLSKCLRLKSLPSDMDQMLKSLKRLNLNKCSSFDTLPMLPSNLIELDLTGTSIEHVPSSSIEHLSSLETLTLNDCTRLKSLPAGICKLKSLKRLNLNKCSSFDMLPMLPSNLIELDLTGMSIEHVPSSSIEHLSSLEMLTLNDCTRLKSLPAGICKLKSLKRLNLNKCSSFDMLPMLPSNLIELDLTGTSIEHVPSSSIEHLSSLETLTLNDCTRLKSLPTGICKLKSLKEIELTSCYKLEILPVILEAIEHLETLYFRATGFQVLPTLVNFPILTSLDLSSYDISEIPNDIGCLYSLENLCLHSTSVQELPSSICSLYNLGCLNLRFCRRLKGLPSDIRMLKSLKRLSLNACSSFNRLPVLPSNLIELDLTGTSIEEVPPSSIEHLSFLEELTLNHCIRLKSLPSDMDQMLYSLTHLYLNGCSSFDRLPVLPRNLMKLDLTGTSIEHVPSSSIEHLSSLEELMLNDCIRLKSLPSDMDQMLYSLTHLYLNGCSSFDRLPVLPRNLMKLDLTGTSIEHVPSSSIEHLSSLEELMLNDCIRLKSLPSDMDQMLYSLTHLYLDGCSSFDKLPVLPRNLIELDLTGTSIEHVPSSCIEHLSSLEKLMFHDCTSLKSLPTGICKLKSLEELQFQHCYKLEIFPAILEPMEHLETLNFREAGIRVLSSLANLPFLTSLDLTSCNLSEIPNDIGCLFSLETLRLDESNIEEIPVSIKNISKLIVLSMTKCERLKSLPKLPLSLNYLDASGCISLETISNSSDEVMQGLRRCNHVITYHEFLYVDCLKLDQNMRNNIVREFWLRTLDTAIKSLQPDGELISVDAGVSVCCPGNQIPMLFTYKSESSSINIILSSNWSKTNFLGFAFCTVIAEDTLELDLCCKANFKTNYGESYNLYWVFSERTIVLHSNSSNVFMLYNHENSLNCDDIVEVSFCFYNETGETKVTACGVRPIYLQDADELGIIHELGKSNAATNTLEEPRLKRIKTGTFSSQGL